MLALVRQLVELESPSDDKAAIDRLGNLLAREFARRGAKVTVHPDPTRGHHLQADFPGDGRPVLLLGHMDTVWSVGTLASMPFRVERDRAYGPGIFDMKAGIALGLFAIDALRERAGAQPKPLKPGSGLSGLRPVTVLLVTDEEVGSRSSRAITEKLARESAAVLVLEPAAGVRGACKTARKGVGVFHLKVSGVSAHAGLDFARGHSAVLELSRQLVRIAGFTNRRNGVTVNAGVVRGGTRANVVAAGAEAEIDLRFARQRDGVAAEKRLRALKPYDRACKIEVTGGINRPPLERGKHVVALYRQAVTLARELGFKLEETAVGGGSDGNFTAALGVPTLDGLGAIGDGAHAAHEHVVISELPRRAALIARLIETVA